MLRTRQQRAAEAAESELQRENERLRQLLAERASQGSYKSGYLNKFRPYSTGNLWANPWEARYVLLRDQCLTYFRSERDVTYPPRGQILLADTFVEPEGLKKRKFWTFRVVDRAGVMLIRLSTEIHSDYLLWMDALERAGCIMKKGIADEDSQRTFSPNPSGMSPSHSGVSESTADTATSGQRGSAWRSGEVDSAQGQYQERLRPQPSGYTSDASDAGYRAAPHARRRHKGPPDASAPVHMQNRFSLLSSERISITNESGLLTLVFIVLAATNFRLILENLMKYGLRFNPLTFFRDALTPSGNFALLLCWPALLGFALVALYIEKFAAHCMEVDLDALEGERKKRDDNTRQRLQLISARGKFVEHLVVLLNLLNTSLALFIPCWVIHITEAEPLPSFALTMATTVLWLKLVSFAHVNWSLRRSHRRYGKEKRFPGETHSGVEPHCIEEDDVYYPKNLTHRKFLYFLAAPTLCYQLSYPRSPRVRLRWMLKRVSMFCAAVALMLFFFEQYIEPTIDNSLKPLQEMDWLRMAERVLKLSIPTLYFWLAMFYALFDLWLNILAEMTRFGDREFYKEWWNATTLGEYWRLWNMPVHKWMVRHVYFPCIGIGMPKFLSGVVVFFVSAVFHELLVGVPLHMLRGWAFWGIMAQVPLMWVTEVLKNKFKNDRVGNVIFWVSFCFLGQPLAEILYFHDWRKAQSAI